MRSVPALATAPALTLAQGNPCAGVSFAPAIRNQHSGANTCIRIALLKVEQVGKPCIMVHDYSDSSTLGLCISIFEGSARSVALVCYRACKLE
eukprot:6195051-Pleurochrysis_carterae.AAC.1